MRIRFACVVAVLLLVPAAARADGHKMDFYGAFSLASGSTLVGTHGSYSFAAPYLWPRNVNIVAVDFSLHNGEHDGNDVKPVSVVHGVRVWFRSAKSYEASAPPPPKYAFFAHVLVGVVNPRDGSNGTSPGYVVGGGMDYVFHQLGNGDALAVRAQVDYVAQRGHDLAPRVSAGLAYRLKDRH